MPTDVIMPALGVAQETGTLLNWLKAEGQSVTQGEPLMEIETDKATVEIEAPASGILSHVTARPGDEIPVGQKIALILAPSEAPPTKEQAPPALDPISLPPGEARGEDRHQTSTPELAGKPVTQRQHVSERALASPAAKRIAKERNIDLGFLKGSGPDGAVLAEDVLRSARDSSGPARPTPKIKETVQLTPMRRIVGERMTESKRTAPHFYLTMDADMSAITRQRSMLKENESSLVPSINDFILSASAQALRDFPSLNAAFSEEGVRVYSDINIGMAVALDEGLVVPVIRNADRLSLENLAKQSRDLADKAQNKRLLPSDYEGGTFTVSNLGMFGVESFVAIINPPQCAILAVGQVTPRVVAHGEGIAVRPMMTLSLSADHRVVDGAIAARFLQEIKKLLEKGTF
jgi:pyruvate dehydrogenase E2 component (dihydrolipoamide acetyltransferase)